MFWDRPSYTPISGTCPQPITSLTTCRVPGRMLFTLHAGKFFMLLLLSTNFFQNLLFKKNSFRITIRVSNGLISDHVLIGVQTVCKVYQEKTEFVASKESVTPYHAGYFMYHRTLQFLSNYLHIWSTETTEWILISWLKKKLADMFLHCFQNRIHLGLGSEGRAFVPPNPNTSF